MEKIKKYQKIIITILNEMATDVSDTEEEHEAIITDTKHHHYFLQWLGFDDSNKFVNKPLLHFHIKSKGKIWILANLTDEDIAETLIKRGVQRTDVVVGFHPRKLREHTGYAVG
jgi:XisI protein